MIHNMMRIIVNIEYRWSQKYRKKMMCFFFFLLSCMDIFLELVQGLNNNCNCCSVTSTYLGFKRSSSSTKWSSSLICCTYRNVRCLQPCLQHHYYLSSYDLPKNYGLLFDVVHFIVCLQGERLDMGDKFSATTQNHPFASWLSSLLLCFAGGFLVNPLCGEPVLEVLDPLRLAIFTVIWYCLFYSPGDHVYTLSKLKPVKILLYLLKGLYYPKKIVAGIKHAKHVFHGNWIAYVCIATVKSNGSGFIKPLARLVRGATDNITESFETLKPSVTTKFCFLSALLYVLFPIDLVYIIICGLLMTMKAGPLFTLQVDVFSPLEKKLCPLLFEKRPEADHAAKKD